LSEEGFKDDKEVKGFKDFEDGVPNKWKLKLFYHE